MAHGAPDWFGTTPQGMVHRVADLAELAARLGSPDVFDRRGNVLFMDSFENGQNNWSHGALVGVAAVYPVAYPVRTGALAVAIATDAAAGAFTHILSHFALPFISRMGAEVAFVLPANARDMFISLTVDTPGGRWAYTAMWDQPAGQLSVLNAAGAFQVIATIGALYIVDPTWHAIKLVVDPVSGMYVCVLLDGATYAIPAIAAFPTPGVFADRCTVNLSAASDVAGSREFVFDDFILTVNE